MSGAPAIRKSNDKGDIPHETFSGGASESDVQSWVDDLNLKV